MLQSKNKGTNGQTNGLSDNHHFLSCSSQLIIDHFKITRNMGGGVCVKFMESMDSGGHRTVWDTKGGTAHNPCDMSVLRVVGWVGVLSGQ